MCAGVDEGVLVFYACLFGIYTFGHGFVYAHVLWCVCTFYHLWQLIVC